MTIWEFLDYAGDFAAEYDLEITERTERDGWLGFTATCEGQSVGQYQVRLVTATINDQLIELVEVHLKEEVEGGFHRYFVSRPVDLIATIYC